MLSRNFLKFSLSSASLTSISLSIVNTNSAQKRLMSYAEVLAAEEQDPTQKEKRMAKYRSIIDEQVKQGCVIYIKGTPANPKCGFSKALVQTLNKYKDAKYQYYDVMADVELRLSIVDYTQWPSIPQIYLDGVFIGGCDVLLTYHSDNMLEGQLIACGAIEAKGKASKE